MRRTTRLSAALALTSAVVATAVGAQTFTTAQQAAPTTAAAATPTEAATAITTARVRLAALEADADRAGRAAEIADEALLQRDTAANRAATDRAEAALATLATQQTPELTTLLRSLTEAGVSTAQPAEGVTITTAALVGRTRALRAVSYARKQIGDPYGYADAGPTHWDCSGLTMRSYTAVDVGIGGHSATAQWSKAKQHHRLVSFAHKKPGDLIFYGSPGAVYHVAIYAGHGRMIEAPYPGKRVREVAVRSAGRLANVARPA